MQQQERGPIMTWFKVDDSFYDHPKVDDLPDSAGMLWLRAGSYCARHLTDGVVPDRRARRMCDNPDEGIKALLDSGLWEIVEGGYRFHDWEKYQPTRDEVLADRESNAARQKAWRDRKRAARKAAAQDPVTPNGERDEHPDTPVTHAVSNGVTDSVTNGARNGAVTASVTGAPTRPDPARPVVPKGTTTKEDQNPMVNAARRPGPEILPGTDQALIPVDAMHASSVTRASRDAQFDAYWKPYPRKVGKQGARKVWDTKVKNGADPDAITAGAVAFAEHVRAWQTPEDKIPHPSTWLNAGRWEDVLTPPSTAVALPGGQPVAASVLPDGRSLNRKSTQHFGHLAAYGDDPDA
jgi:hypothetical protein